MFDVTLYRDARVMPPSSSALPLDRPATVRKATGKAPKPPAVRMSADEVAAAVAATDTAWASYIAGVTVTPTAPEPDVIVGEDGKIWKVNAAGKLQEV